MRSCAHGTSECSQREEYQDRAGRLRHRYGQPQADTCCWRCLLPTRVCKGALAQADITRCFDPNLVIVFWLVVRDYRGDLMDDLDACLDPALLPQAEKEENILLKRWELDTEMVLGALLFYRFAISHSARYGYKA